MLMLIFDIKTRLQTNVFLYFSILLGFFVSLVYTKKTKSAFQLQARGGMCDTGCGQVWSSMVHAFMSPARAPQAAIRIPNEAWVSFHAESVWVRRSYTKICSLFISSFGVRSLGLNSQWSTWNLATSCPWFCHFQSDVLDVFANICDVTETRRQHKIPLPSKFLSFL